MRVEAGATRVVFIGRRLVVKVPRARSWYLLLAGLLSNLNEASVWREHRGDPRLCPMVFWLPGGWANVMRRAQPVYVGAIEPGRFEDLTHDLHHENFGSFEGRIVLLDYA